MAKLEDLLKAGGATDEDLAAMSTLLNDPKFRASAEKGYGLIEDENKRFKEENEKWASWHETDGKPLMQMYEKERADAIAEAASLRARLELAEKEGFAPRRQEPTTTTTTPQTTTTPSGETWDPKKYNVPTWDDVKKLADAEGQAIAMVQDLTMEYQYLTGKNLLDYSYTTSDGRQLRGMTALRAESMANKAPDIRQFAESKFGFQAHRDRIADEQRKKAEDAIRADERNKVIGQYGNPNTRPMMPSNDPFIPAPREAGKQPWEIPQQDRQRARVERAMQNQLKSNVQ